MLLFTVFDIYRRSITIKETLRIIQVYNFSYPNFLIERLQTMKLVLEIKRYPYPRNSFISSLLLQRKRSGGEKRLLETIFLELRSIKDQKHPKSRWLLIIKRGILSKRREPQSVWRRIILIIRIYKSKAPQRKCTRLQLLLVIVFNTLALEYICHVYLFPNML